MIDIDGFTALCAELIEELPPALLKTLNGGILVSDRLPDSDDDPPGTCRLGEYVVDPHLGRYIVIYYRSFAAIYGNLSLSQLRQRLREVLRHEMRHHIETAAGVYDLVREDDKRAAAMWRRMRRSEP